MGKQPLDLPELFPELNLIQDTVLRDKVGQIWQRMWEESSFERPEDVPVDVAIPYSNLKHIQSYVRCLVAVARVFEDVHEAKYNYDYLIAGGLLADVSKQVEMAPKDGVYERTEIGGSLPHATYAAHVAMETGLPLEVVHIIAAHSPNSSKLPVTPEAQLVYWLDQADLTGFGHDLWKRIVVHRF